MPRPDRSVERRAEFLPILARTFAENSYRKTTTALLAEACGVQEPALYRLWPDKRAMFLASLDYVHDHSVRIWKEILAEEDERSGAERILDYEAQHHGEQGLYRLVFAGLSEVDDPEIAKGMARLFRRFHTFVKGAVREHRSQSDIRGHSNADLTSWAILGLGTVSNIGRELGLLSAPARKRLLAEVGRALLGE